MRKILSISLQEDVLKAIKKTAKTKNFKSVSDYIKTLFEEDTNDLISEKELVEELKAGKEECKKGKLKELKSLKDLM